LLTCHLIVEFATIGQTEDGKIYHRLWSAEEINELLKKNDLAKAEDTEEK
jgi:20S proteasome subunit alpha 3